jgi:hypothetical protein
MNRPCTIPHLPVVQCARFNGFLRVHDQTKSNNIAAIGQIEAMTAWQRHLGTNPNLSFAPVFDRQRQRYAPIRHPLLIGWPYVRWRIFR